MEVQSGIAIAAIQSTPDVIVEGFTDCTFQAQGVSGILAPPATFTWDFGDGTQATGEAPHHTYMADATYTVRLTVSDAKSTGRLTAPVLVRTVAGTWVRDSATNYWHVIKLQQSGTTVTGSFYEDTYGTTWNIVDGRVDFPKLTLSLTRGTDTARITGDLNACLDHLIHVPGLPGGIGFVKYGAPACGQSSGARQSVRR